MSVPFRTGLGTIAAFGLGVRLWAIDRYYRALELGFTDNFFYSEQARAIADGQGFIDPFIRDATGQLEPSASHPPLYSAYLAVWSLLGLESATWHRVASAVLGLATIVLVGLVARRLAGDRAALVAAALAAVFPPLWIADGTIVSEALYAPLAAAVMLTGLRVVERPDTWRGACLGVAIGAAALTRSEALALVVLCGLPLVLVARRPWRARLRLLGVVGLASAVTISPWVIRNLQAFEEPVVLSYGAGYVLKIGNCDRTYHGEFLGYWHIDCAFQGSMTPDPSIGEVRARGEALDYVGENLDRVPVVVAARVGRLWHLYRPAQGVDFDGFYERRGALPSALGLWAFYGLVPLAVAGVWGLRRRADGLVVTGSLIASASLAGAMAFAVTRYRIAGDVALVALAGVGVEQVLRRWRPGTPDQPR